ncbi:MAG: isoprenylcysteine carboxylmethyltransferase family protein [Candidatus Omnitrophica bacterium]|nr:isoprenylcysteine carboxylmethyltransferase family protein [Candidatus Omnitrophota bacterium]
MLSPLFAVALLSSRRAPSLRMELLQDMAGLLSLFGGTWLRLVAASYHDSSHNREPITAGPYAWVRHPLYLANFLIGLGIVLIAGWRPMVIFYCLFFLPLHFLIARAEEVHLTGLYGGKYEVYRCAVPAILPWWPFKGPRYGSRNPFKLKKGQEWLKVAGYLAGILGILCFKQFRQNLELPFLQEPLPPLGYAVGLTLVLLMVIFRPKMRSSLLRAFQTGLSTAIILFLALHLPGVWPEGRGAASSSRSRWEVPRHLRP